MVAGHELHLIGDETRRDSRQLAAYFADHGISAWETTPGYLRQLLTEPEFTRLLDAHAADGGQAGRFSLALGGEAFDAGLWDTVAAHPGVQAWNLYGPTEATVDTVLARVEDTGGPVLGTAHRGHAALRPGRQAAAHPARRGRRTLRRRPPAGPRLPRPART